jgi:hypothetical protein
MKASQQELTVKPSESTSIMTSATLPEHFSARPLYPPLKASSTEISVDDVQVVESSGKKKESPQSRVDVRAAAGRVVQERVSDSCSKTISTTDRQVVETRENNSQTPHEWDGHGQIVEENGQYRAEINQLTERVQKAVSTPVFLRALPSISNTSCKERDRETIVSSPSANLSSRSH